MARSTIAAVIAVAVFAAALQATAATAAPKKPAAPTGYQGWHMDGGNAQQTGVTENPIASNSGIAWKYSATGTIIAGAVASKDGTRVYMVTTDHMVHALNVDPHFEYGIKQAFGGGEPKVAWSYKTGTSSATATFKSAPALSEDEQTLYVGTIDSEVVALYTSNGTAKWVHPTGGSISSSLLYYKGYLFYGTSNTEFEALNETTGEHLYGCNANAPIQGSPAISSDGKQVLFTSADTYLYAVDIENTNPVCHQKGAACPTAFHSGQFTPCADWYVRVSHNSIVTSPVVDGANNRVLVTTNGGEDAGGLAGLYGIVPPTNPGGPVSVTKLLAIDADIRTPATLLPYNKVALGASDGHIYYLSINDTMAVVDWKYDTGSAVTSTVIANSGSLVFGTVGGQVMSLDHSGGLIWSATVGSQVTAPPAIGLDGIVIIGNNNGDLFGIGSPKMLLLRIIIGVLFFGILVCFCCLWRNICCRNAGAPKASAGGKTAASTKTDDVYVTLGDGEDAQPAAATAAAATGAGAGAADATPAADEKSALLNA